jgi:hypothetical protein
MDNSWAQLDVTKVEGFKTLKWHDNDWSTHHKTKPHPGSAAENAERNVFEMAKQFFASLGMSGLTIMQSLGPEGKGTTGHQNPLAMGSIGKFVRVSEFLAGKGTVQKGPIPWLFCDSTFLTPKSVMDHAQDMLGNPIAGPDGAPILISSEYGAQLVDGKLPFWSEDIHTYIFDKPGHGDKHCAATAGNNDLAVTVDTRHIQLDGNYGT